MDGSNYLAFTLAHSHFYDVPARSSERFSESGQIDWTGWTIDDHGPRWRVLVPSDVVLPEQGWKIHCSTTPATARRTLDAVSRYCGSRRIAFKFLRSPVDLDIANGKQVDRGSSGKFVTIYPESDEECSRILNGLDAVIGGMNGPYVLSDIRWRRGPLYLRYGGFRMMSIPGPDGGPVPAIRRPDGALEPDRRGPTFSSPPWLDLPPFVTQARAALHSDEQFPFRVRSALHFSNTGGVYRATDTAGRDVVLKEGRAFTAPDRAGRHATDRIRSEHAVLVQLQHNSHTPEATGLLERAGHVFLACEHIDGTPLNAAVADRHPLVRCDSDRAARLSYTEWAVTVADRLRAAVDSIHADGVVHGDLHPPNVLVRPDGSITIVDFEMSHRIDDLPRTYMGATGFAPPGATTGVAADRHALACVVLSMFVPLTPLLALSSAKASDLIHYAGATFELPDRLTTWLTLVLVSETDTDDCPIVWDTTTPEARTRSLRAVDRAVLGSFDPGRTDRAFPGDVRQFDENGFGIAHGACGSVLATGVLATGGRGSEADRIWAWIADAVDEDGLAHPGFFDGLAGAVHTARCAGRDDLADAWTARLCAAPLDDHPHDDLYRGLTGVGCALLQEHRRCPSDDVEAALRTVVGELSARPASRRTGLMHGRSGQALFWAAHHRVTGDADSLSRAVDLVDADLDSLAEGPDGSLQVADGHRLLPYLASGSVGVGLVLLHLVDQVDRPDHATRLRHGARGMYRLHRPVGPARRTRRVHLLPGPSRTDAIRRRRHLNGPRPPHSLARPARRSLSRRAALPG